MDRSMTIEEKQSILAQLKTGDLIKSIHAAEAELETVLKETFKCREDYALHLKASRTNSETVSDLEARLTMEVPDEIAGKKLTAPEKTAWLKKQRTENKDLAAAYTKQKMAEAVMADLDIRKTMAEVKLSNLKGVMALRAAQITFLAGDVRILTGVEEKMKEEKK